MNLRNLIKILQTATLAAGLAAPGLVLGEPVINYTNTITEVDADGSGTFGDSDADFYTVGLTMKNFSNGLENSATNLVYGTNLEDCGAFNLRDQFSVWTPTTNGAGSTMYAYNGIDLTPGAENTVLYDVQANQVIGWDITTAYMEAETGQSNVMEATVPVIPEPVTAGLLALGGVGLIGMRRFFRMQSLY